MPWPLPLAGIHQLKSHCLKEGLFVLPSLLLHVNNCGRQHGFCLPLSEPSSEPPEPLSPRPLALPAELLSEPLESPNPLALPVELLSEPDPPEPEPATFLLDTCQTKHQDVHLILLSLSRRLLQWSQPRHHGMLRMLKPESHHYKSAKLQIGQGPEALRFAQKAPHLSLNNLLA